jgi:hypothetical protein
VLDDAQLPTKVPKNAQEFHTFMDALWAKSSADMSAMLRRHSEALHKTFDLLREEATSTCKESQSSPTVVDEIAEFSGDEHCEEQENLACSPQTRATIHDERLVVSPQPIRGFQEPCV